MAAGSTRSPSATSSRSTRSTTRVGSSVYLTPLLLVDGDRHVRRNGAGQVSVTAEVLGATKGPKIQILKYKNKTGYRKRQGHRQQYTQVKVTGIES